MEYQHGGDIYSQDIQMDYSANINPLGMPEAVRQALRDCLEREVCSLYPDSRCKKLRQALGRHHGVEDKWIIWPGSRAAPCARAGDSPGLFRV